MNEIVNISYHGRKSIPQADHSQVAYNFLLVACLLVESSAPVGSTLPVISSHSVTLLVPLMKILWAFVYTQSFQPILIGIRID